MKKILMFVLLAGCGDSFSPAQLVTGLRFLGVGAEPPELVPGETDAARLTSLVADPAHLGDPEARTTTAYFGCTPGTTGEFPCTTFEELRDLDRLVRGASVGACPGAPGEDPELGTAIPGAVVYLGAEVCGEGGCAPLPSLPAPEYRLPTGIDLDVLLPPGAPERVLGVEAVVLAIALPLRPEEIVAGTDACADLPRWPAAVADRLAGEHATAVKRIVIRGPDAPDEPNVNPVPPVVRLDGRAPDETVAKESVRLSAAPTDPSLLQTYTILDPVGNASGTTREDWAHSWYVTGGSLDARVTRENEVVWELPDGSEDRPSPPAAHGDRLRLWVVTRDLRGGTAWTVIDLRDGR